MIEPTLRPYKYTFLMFLGIFELGSLLCGTAASSEILIIGRAVSGLGGSGIVNGAFTIFAATASIEKRPCKSFLPKLPSHAASNKLLKVLIGVSMATTNLGSIVGPVLGGTLVQNLSWRWCESLLFKLFNWFSPALDQTSQTYTETNSPQVSSSIYPLASLPASSYYA